MLALQKRLHISFALSLLLVLLIGGLSFYYLHLFDQNVRQQLREHIEAIQQDQLATMKEVSAFQQDITQAATLRTKLNQIHANRFHEFSDRQQRIDYVLSRTQRNLILVLMLVVGGGLALAFITPIRAVWPFKRLYAAFQEAESGNLTVRLPVGGATEMRELASAFNRLMVHLEELDEKKTKRIQFVQRRFETLANVMDAAVILVNVEGEILFFNAPAYRVLGLTSDQVVGQPFEKVALPEDLKKILTQAVEQKGRIEDEDRTLDIQTNGKKRSVCATLDVFPITRYSGEIVNMLIVLEERCLPEEKRLFQRHVENGKNI